jgi:hypothetical protein
MEDTARTMKKKVRQMASKHPISAKNSLFLAHGLLF